MKKWCNTEALIQTIRTVDIHLFSQQIKGSVVTSCLMARAHFPLHNRELHSGLFVWKLRNQVRLFRRASLPLNPPKSGACTSVCCRTYCSMSVCCRTHCTVLWTEASYSARSAFTFSTGSSCVNYTTSPGDHAVSYQLSLTQALLCMLLWPYEPV